MRKRRKGSWGPRRVLDETTRQVMVGDDVLKAAAPVKPLDAPIPRRVPGILSLLYGKESA